MNWDPYYKTNKIKLKKALLEYFLIRDKWFEALEQRDTSKMNYIISVLDKRRLKLNSMVEKYFFTDLKIREFVKRETHLFTPWDGIRSNSRSHGRYQPDPKIIKEI